MQAWRYALPVQINTSNIGRHCLRCRPRRLSPGPGKAWAIQALGAPPEEVLGGGGHQPGNAGLWGVCGPCKRPGAAVSAWQRARPRGGRPCSRASNECRVRMQAGGRRRARATRNRSGGPGEGAEFRVQLGRKMYGTMRGARWAPAHQHGVVDVAAALDALQPGELPGEIVGRLHCRHRQRVPTAPEDAQPRRRAGA
jgi:hypothetical protein